MNKYFRAALANSRIRFFFSGEVIVFDVILIFCVLLQWICNGGVLLCGLSGLLHELVNHWTDVATFLLNPVHVSVLEADAEMQMRFAMWSIIMQIGKILSLPFSF